MRCFIVLGRQVVHVGKDETSLHLAPLHGPAGMWKSILIALHIFVMCLCQFCLYFVFFSFPLQIYQRRWVWNMAKGLQI